MKKTALIVLLLATACTPLHAQRLKDQANRLEKGVQKLAKSHHRLWTVARTLWARVQHLENELQKQEAGSE